MHVAALLEGTIKQVLSLLLGPSRGNNLSGVCHFSAGMSSLSPGDELHLTLRTDPNNQSVSLAIPAKASAQPSASAQAAHGHEPPMSAVAAVAPASAGRAEIFTVTATVIQAAERAWLRLGPEPDAAAADFRVLRVRRDVLVSVPAFFGGDGGGEGASGPAQEAAAAEAAAGTDTEGSARGGMIAPVLSVVVVKGKGLWPAPPARRSTAAAKAAAAAAAESFCRVSVVGGVSRYTRSQVAGPTGDPVWGDAFRLPLRTAAVAAEDGRGAIGRREIAEDQELVLHVYRTMAPPAHGHPAPATAAHGAW